MDIAVNDERPRERERERNVNHLGGFLLIIDTSTLDAKKMTVTSVPCQVIRSTTQVYFNIRIDQKRRRAIHFCEQCRYYGRYCDAIHKGRKDHRISASFLSLKLFLDQSTFSPDYRILSTCFDTIGTNIDITENSQIAH